MWQITASWRISAFVHNSASGTDGLPSANAPTQHNHDYGVPWFQDKACPVSDLQTLLRFASIKNARAGKLGRKCCGG